MSLLDPRHIRTRLTLYFVSILALIQIVYSGAACFLMLRDLRSQLVRHAIQDLETVEGLLHITTDGRVWLKDDYHNHPESKLVLERLLEVRSPDGAVLLRNEMLGDRSLGEAMLPNEGVGGYSAREFTLRDGMRVQLVSRYHWVEGRPTVIRLAYSQEPLWTQFRSDLGALVLPLPLVLFLAGLGGYRLASNALQPIQSMARKAEEIRSDRLHERLPVNPADGELAELAQVFNSVLQQLQQSFDQLRRFTSDASHELRTPLTGIRSVGEVALQHHSSSPESYRDAIGSMLEEANKLTKLVDNLLAIARADAGEIHLHPATFSVKALVDECTSLLEVLLEENAQTLTVDVPVDCHLRADWLLLRQALVNVLHNAIKFTPPGGAIQIQAIQRQNDVIISVEDSGPGIPAESLPKIFDRFYRVEKGRSPGAGGTGLGLAITRWTVEMHRGTITAESQPGKGAVIRITLPATPEPDAVRVEGASQAAERHVRV